MKILAVPVSDRDSASCRIRYHLFLENIPKGHTVENYAKGKTGDILYIQKLITPQAKAIAKDAHRNGIPIVYDRDDFRRRWDQEGYNEILDIASAITTDTHIRADMVKSHTKTPVFVVPDCLDYGVTKSDKIEIRESICRAVTYGRHRGVEAAVSYFNQLKIPAVYICDRIIPSLKKYKLKIWNRKKFIQHLRKYDLAILSHKDVWTAKYKSNNRLLVAMSIGLPVLAVKSPAYIDTLTDAGYPELIINEPKEMPAKVKMLQDKTLRKKISDNLFDYAWNNYHPEKSSKILLEVFEYAVKRSC